MGTNGASESVFAQFIDRPEREPAPPLPLPTPPEALRLLDWLRDWSQTTVCLRDIYHFGPGRNRDRESTIKAAEILEKRGWLIPLKSHRYDRKRWQ